MLSSEDSVCPCCGVFIQEARDSGWCEKCEKLRCSVCGDSAPCVKYQCRLEIFMSQNADDIEQLLLAGLSLTRAVKKCRPEPRTCVVCGTEIKEGNFCTTNDFCKKYRRRYKKMLEKGKSQSEALGEILEQVA